MNNTCAATVAILPYTGIRCEENTGSYTKTRNINVPICRNNNYKK